MKKTAIITGITGQDGAYLTKHLLELGDYNVVGLARRSSSGDFFRLKRLGIDLGSITIDTFDLCEPFSMARMIDKYKPDEIYNLAAQSFVGASFETPLYTMEVNATGVYRWVEAIVNSKLPIKFYQAGTSEMFGMAQEIPQTERTSFYPRSPYGVAKLSAYWFVKNYRESHNLFGCNGILFNHESPLRGLEFVTRKITNGLARLHLGKSGPVALGNIDSVRDWGHAEDYVAAMHTMMQQDKPGDYVISTNEIHTVREFCEIASKQLGYDLKWVGTGLDEQGIDTVTGKVLITINPKFFRPTDVDFLQGDCEKAKIQLQWCRKHSFNDLVTEMVLSDLKLEQNESAAR
jgi:GDPmannose 4,6-dehydratase